MCRINPRVDFAFKKLFGSEENKDLLLSLINAVIGEHTPIVDLVLKNPYNLADYHAGKMSILDIKATDEHGRWYNVEMQISVDFNFDKRAIYYWSRLVTEQLSEGMMFKELQKTFSINILNFNFINNREEFHNCYKILNVDTLEDDELHDVFELHYIELRKFHKDYQHLNSALDRWMLFLSRAHELDKSNLPAALANDQAIIKAVSAVDRMFDEEERQVYEVRMQALAEVYSKIASALDRGMQVGIAQGIEKGLEQGLEQGLVQGKQEGIYETKRQVVLVAYQQGLSIEVISRLTQLSLEQIQDILDANNTP